MSLMRLMALLLRHKLLLPLLVLLLLLLLVVVEEVVVVAGRLRGEPTPFIDWSCRIDGGNECTRSS